MTFEPWHVEPDGMLTAEYGGLRLVARIVGGWARYLVFKRASGTEACPPVLVASGTERDLRATMAAAERTAEMLIGAAQPVPHRAGWVRSQRPSAPGMPIAPARRGQEERRA